MVQDVPTPFALAMQNVQTGHRTEVTRLTADATQAVECDRLTLRWLGRAR
jgi:hypothetical protein